MKSRSIIIDIVEDAPEIAENLKKYIDSKEGYQCRNILQSGEEALKAFRLEPLADIIIHDIGLPGISGVEVLRNMQDKFGGTKVIMFTMFDDDEYLFSALKEGASGYILKNDSYEEILEAIEEVMNGGAPMSPTIALKIIKSFQRPKDNRLESLTVHQTDILNNIAKGLLNKEIADKLGVVEGTIKLQITSIYKKLQVNNRVEAVSLYNKLK